MLAHSLACGGGVLATALFVQFVLLNPGPAVVPLSVFLHEVCARLRCRAACTTVHGVVSF
ncbi:hypothetical protein EON66_00750 [archaeon]|nr:MAG: hypothetical protein EON66_00750 [archaeon]